MEKRRRKPPTTKRDAQKRNEGYVRVAYKKAQQKEETKELIRLTRLLALEMIEHAFDPERIVVKRQLTAEQMNGVQVHVG